MPGQGDSQRAQRPLAFIDETLRDGHQSLWATRLSFDMIAPILPTIDRAGYDVLDITGSMHFEVQVRYLRENPWDRIRAIKRLAPTTPLNSWMRTNNVISFEFMPRDMIELWIKCLAGAGISRLTAGDPLFDLNNIRVVADACRQYGIDYVGALQFSESPVHTDSLFARTAGSLKDLGAKAILIKDPSSLLTPQRIETLIPAVREAIGPHPLEIHSHCLTGLSPYVYLRAIELGIDGVQTATQPLANGPSLPPTEQVTEFAMYVGRPHALDMTAIGRVAEYFTRLARKHRKPIGQIAALRPQQLSHQLPGGMISNLQVQLNEIGKEDLLPQVLEEVSRVRRELGYLNVVTPFAQMVATQAVINVVRGERYRTVPDEVVRYALGHYGEVLAPIDSDVLDRLMSTAAAKRYASEPELRWSVDKARAVFGRDITDEELLLRVSIPEEYLAAMRSDLIIDEGSRSTRGPIKELLKTVGGYGKVGYVRVSNDEATITVRRPSSDQPSSDEMR